MSFNPLLLSAIFGVLAASPTSAGQVSPAERAHDDHGTPPSPERIHRYEPQEVVLEDFTAEGYVLDIGGGGEGVIGQLKPSQVVAIDISARELAGAPAGPLKIVMDATDLKFLDGTFNTATSFFTLMYMNPETQDRAAREIYRVLAPGGRFLVWDVLLPARFDEVKDIAAFPMKVRLHGREISTGYGTFFPKVPHDVAYFVALAERSGFEIASKRESGRTFFMELRKPVRSRTP